MNEEIRRCCRLLDISENTSIGEIKSSYRTLVKVWHPDRFQNDPDLAKKAQEKLKEINIAYEKLKCFWLEKDNKQFRNEDRK
jgi:curved DNA-binding protein CbpA